MGPFTPGALARFFADHKDWLEDRIAAYVSIQSPSNQFDSVDALADIMEEDLRRLGAEVEQSTTSPRPVLARFGTGKPSLVLIFHHDTVWPVDSFPNARKEKGLWFSPGIFDMKANLPLLMLSIKYLGQYLPQKLPNIMWISSPDEEILGPVSSKVIPAYAGGCHRALVFEPPLSRGQLKQRRKGCGRLSFRFVGKSSHTGNHYQKGCSALKAAARFLIFAEALSDFDVGLTINVGLLQGGSAVNTRPGEANMEMDIRFTKIEQWQPTVEQLASYLDPDGVAIQMASAGFLPPMQAIHEDWQFLKEACLETGCPFELGSSGGGSDGSRLAALGLRVMDGLGVMGGGEHASHEHIELAALEAYFCRNTRLLLKLLNAPFSQA